MLGAVQGYFNTLKRKVTTDDGCKQSKKRLKRNGAECLTSDEVLEQMKETQDAAKKKEADALARKERAKVNLEKREEAKKKAEENRQLREMRKAFKTRMDQRKKEKADQKKRNKINKECYSCSNFWEEEEDKGLRKLWTFCRVCNLWCCNECLPQDFQMTRKKFICNNCVLEEEEYKAAKERLDQEINARVEAQA